MRLRKLEKEDSSMTPVMFLRYLFPFNVNLDIEKSSTVDRSITETLSFTGLNSLSWIGLC